MKFYSLMLACLLALPVNAYQAGTANRATFGSSPQTQQQTGYRSFSNYNSRYGQRVQTQTVQTSVAGSSVADFSRNDKQPVVGKKAATMPNTKTAKPTPGVPASAQASSTTASVPALPANADPAAMLQQVQGMMQNMTGTTVPAGQQPVAGQAAAGMTMPSVPGMPDLSALMGGMNPPAAPAPAPASAPTKK